MYLKLSVAGHLTIFLTRTRGPFWSIRPAKTLWIAVLGTQTLATLIAVYGLFMAPLGWKWAGFVWGYAIVWALINDRIKLLAYKIFDPVKAEAKSEPKPEAKVNGPKPEAKAGPDLTPQIAARAYELYGERAGNGGTAVQDWKKAEQEIRKPEAKAEPTPEANNKPQPDATPQLIKRVHGLYEELGREDVQSVQDWEKAHPELEEHESHK
jgi:H+-transporting ATPase